MAFCPVPSFEIPRPPVEAPLHGLLDVAYVPDLSGYPSGDERDRWQAGITFAPNPTSCADHVTPWQPFTDDPQDKAMPTATVPVETYHTFILTYSDICQVVPSQLDAAVELAKAALVAGTGQAVEAIFWGSNSDGPLAGLYAPEGNNFSLSSSTPLVTGFAPNTCSGIINRDPTGSGIVAYTPKQALLALTQALGNCALGARGVLHAPVYLAEDWAERGLIRLSDPADTTSNFMTNIRGDLVAGGSGYSGTGPAGHPLETPADGYAWAYATGPVGVLLSEPESQETTVIDNSTNLYRIIVERTVAIAANSACLFAAYVDVA